MRYLLLFLSLSFQAIAQLPTGNWHASIALNDTLDLPFTFSSDSISLTIHNGDENIIVNEIKLKGDSVFIQMPVFDSEFLCVLKENSITGIFFNHARKADNVFPFHAQLGLSYRFSDRPERTSLNITGKYHVVFNGEDKESKDAVGVFKQEGNRLTGTFLTTTGDYRFLEGEIGGNRIWLSAFDGSHLFLFTALVRGDSLCEGQFFSGKHWHDTWTGMKDENANLLSPDSLITLRTADSKINFKFPDENGKMISLSDKKYKNKAVIIQIMGSWCPNCMDETKFLADWNRKNKNKKNRIEIIALDFEKIADTTHAYRNIRRLKKQFGVTYPILFAGPSDKKEAVKSLPMLDRIFAYPTLLFLNKEKKVIKTHTGFNGPATGEDYTKFKTWFEQTTNKMKN